MPNNQHPSQRIGVAKGDFNVPDTIDAHNTEVLALLLGLSETHPEWLAAQNQDFERNGLWSDGLVAWRDG